MASITNSPDESEAARMFANQVLAHARPTEPRPTVREVSTRPLPIRGTAAALVLEDILSLQMARDCGCSLSVAELDALMAWDDCVAALADVRAEGEGR
jgi:hypothetical protein